MIRDHICDRCGEDERVVGLRSGRCGHCVRQRRKEDYHRSKMKDDPVPDQEGYREDCLELFKKGLGPMSIAVRLSGKYKDSSHAMVRSVLDGKSYMGIVIRKDGGLIDRLDGAFDICGRVIHCG